MNECETCEMSLSALADGELPAEELLPVLDHLAECPSCRAFYRDLRALAAALPAAAAGPAEATPGEAPEEIWHRIERAAAPAFSRSGRTRPWALRLAAAVVLVAGLWGALATVRALRPAAAPIEVTLGDDRGRMTEQRFVDLTVELLRADSRYHQEMLQVLTAVGGRGQGEEAPMDYDAALPERGDSASDDRRPAQRPRRLS